MASNNTDVLWALDDVSMQIQRWGGGRDHRPERSWEVDAAQGAFAGSPNRRPGIVEVTGRVGSLLEVGTGFHEDLTGRENTYLNGAILGMRRAEIDRKFDEIVAFAEVERFIDTPVKHYSSGMYMRLAFAVAAHLETEILLVDEVLAVGDAQFQKKCLGKMDDDRAARTHGAVHQPQHGGGSAPVRPRAAPRPRPAACLGSDR